MQVKKQKLKLDMEQQTGYKSEKGYIKAVYCHSVYLTSMQSTLCKMPDWVNHKLESRLPRLKKKIAKRNIYNLRTSDIQKINGRN